MLYVVIDLSSATTPTRAVAEFEGMRFKRTENRLKRYSRGGSIAEAIHGGPLRVMRMAPVAELENAILVDRRWTTLADHPWTSHMDTEGIVLQHTTHVTHRVTLVCETGLAGSCVNSVRVEWDFASGKQGHDNNAERVDWLMSRLLGGGHGTRADLVLTRLLRVHKERRDSVTADAHDGPAADDAPRRPAADPSGPAADPSGPAADGDGGESGEEADDSGTDADDAG